MSENGNGTAVAVLDELRPVDAGILQAARMAVHSNDRPDAVGRGDPTLVGKRKVAICGFAPSSYREAPYNNSTWTMENGCEIWGINELYKVPGVTRWDRWFDLHDRKDGDISERDENNIKWMREQKCPFYMHDQYPDIPSSLRLPIEALVEHYRTTYFTNSISYMIAVAGMEGRDERGWVIDPDKAFGEIHVYGVDMAQQDNTPGGQPEYGFQRPSCEYFLGFVRGRNIKVYLPPQSDLLFTPFLYGYVGDPQRFRKKLKSRHAELGERVNYTKNQQLQAQMNAASTEGAARAFDNMAEELAKLGVVPPASIEEMKKKGAELHAQSQTFQQQAQGHLMSAAALEGAQDNLTYVERSWAGI